MHTACLSARYGTLRLSTQRSIACRTALAHLQKLKTAEQAGLSLRGVSGNTPRHNLVQQ